MSTMGSMKSKTGTDGNLSVKCFPQPTTKVMPKTTTFEAEYRG